MCTLSSALLQALDASLTLLTQAQQQRQQQQQQGRGGLPSRKQQQQEQQEVAFCERLVEALLAFTPTNLQVAAHRDPSVMPRFSSTVSEPGAVACVLKQQDHP